MVEIFTPHGIKTPPILFHRPNRANFLRLVFSDQHDGSPSCRPPRLSGQLSQDMVIACVMNGMRCVDPQAVNVKFFDPITGILDDEFPHATRPGPIKIESLSPL